MRITQGTFSFLPDLTDEEIRAQIDYALEQGWAIGVEYTDDPHPRNCYWEMWGNPLFDLRDAARCHARSLGVPRGRTRRYYVRVNAFDCDARLRDDAPVASSSSRPADEPGFRLERHEIAGRQIQYTLESYATRRRPRDAATT